MNLIEVVLTYHISKLAQIKICESTASKVFFFFCRRNRFDGEPESKKNRPAPRREGSGFERYPKNFETVRRAEPPPPPRAELRDSDRREIRDRDERRQVSIPDRPAGGRAPPPAIAHSRTSRDSSHAGWKTDGGMNTKQGDVRYE